MKYKCFREYRISFAKKYIELIDYCLHILFRKNPSIKNINKILLLRQDRIGDLVLTSFIFPQIKKYYPSSEVHVMVAKGNNELLLSNPFVDKVIEHDIGGIDYEIYPSLMLRTINILKYVTSPYFRKVVRKVRAEKYDLGIDFIGKRRNALLLILAGIPYRIINQTWGGSFLGTNYIQKNINIHYIDQMMACLKPLGINGENAEVKIYLNKNTDKVLITEYDNLRKISKHIVGMNINYQKTKQKQWHIENWKHLLNLLVDDGRFFVILYNAQTETKLAKEILRDIFHKNRLIHLTPPNLTCLMHLMKNMDATICVDSGLVHIAAGLDLPTIDLVAGSNPVMWRPSHKKSRVIRKLSGGECINVRCKYSQCLNDISPLEVYEELIKLLSENKLI